ncbi:hypothetical protein [Streptomyces sp900116325]|uniref:hypothetical protein n=1 Tax=Streptomyces sp. 900116325 TaxID=3154295 RepID=UPI0033B90D17
MDLKWTKDREVSGTYYGWGGSGELVATIRKGADRNDWRVEVSGKRQIFRGGLLGQAKTIAQRVLSGLEPEPTPNPFEQEELLETEENSEPSSATEEPAPSDDRRAERERPGIVCYRLPCALPAGHTGLHRDALTRTEWADSESPAKPTAAEVSAMVRQIESGEFYGIEVDASILARVREALLRVIGQ